MTKEAFPVEPGNPVLVNRPVRTPETAEAFIESESAGPQ